MFVYILYLLNFLTVNLTLEKKILKFLKNLKKTVDKMPICEYNNSNHY